MKRILAAFFLLIAASPAQASVLCTLPVTLQNNTLADATQVMADFNALVTCMTGAAAAGANSDITALSGLTTPIVPGSGGTPTFISSVASSGSANAQIVSSVTPTSFTLTTGYKIIFKAGFTNTGPTQINVAATGLTNVFRRTTDGIQAVVGGEIVANSITEAVYDGTQFQLIAALSPLPVGTVLDTIAAAADPGFVLMRGQCSSTTTFAALWVKMGSPAAGACAAGNFALPDGRGRMVAMIDSGGSARITVAGGNFDGTVLYGFGGSQNRTLAQANLGSTWTFTNTNIAVGTPTLPMIGSNTFLVGSTSVQGSGRGADVTYGQATQGAVQQGQANAGGSDTPLPVLPPVLMLNKQVKY